MLNWFAIKLAGARRWAVDILMAAFLLSALLAIVVLAYMAMR
jgi:hypothetical protein